MMNLRNSVQLIGNLGKDPEIKTLESGRKMAKVTIATNDIYKNSKGEKIVDTQWHNLVCWGRVAERMEKYLTKGSEICLQGKLTHSSYKDDKGVTRYSSEVVVHEFMMLSKKRNGAEKEELPVLSY